MKTVSLQKTPEPLITNTLVKWQEVRDQVHKVNSKFAKTIDVLAPNYPLKLKKANYGNVIANQHNLINPAILLDNTCELYFKYQKRILPYKIFSKGEILFAEKIFDSDQWFYQHSLWECTAGCRSVFMLPGISDSKQHQRLLDHYKIVIPKPLEMQDHWQTFTAIANSQNNIKPWTVTLLEFTEEWLQHRDDPAWQEFYQHCAMSALRQTEIQRHKALLDILFGLLQKERHYKLSLPHVEQVSYIIMLGLGGVPGFREATEATMPVELIQKAYQMIYRLKDYAPTIMAPAYFSLNEDATPIYYSLNYQTSYLFSPEQNSFKTIGRDLQEIHWLFCKLRDLVLNKKFIAEESKLYHLMKNHDFRFYHQEASAYREFSALKTIMEYDEGLIKKWKEEGLQLHLHNSFLNGCVGISKVAKNAKPFLGSECSKKVESTFVNLST